MPGYHSLRSPSSAHGWLLCAGRPQAEEACTKRGLGEESSGYAAEGTFFHDVARSALLTGLDADDYLGRRDNVEGFDFEVTAEMARYMQPGLDWIREQRGTISVERRVYLDPVLSGESGTVDVRLVDRRASLLTVFDWKYGREPVIANRNPQLLLYALGSFLSDRSLAGVNGVRLVICQPRVEHGFTVWETTRECVERFGREAREAWDRSFEPNASRTPGPKQCHWCKARTHCQEYATFNLDVIGSKFEDLDNNGKGFAFPDEVALTPERRSYVLRHWPMVEAWHKRLHAAALDEAMRGRTVPGFKLVEGRRGAREYTDPAAAGTLLNELLGDEARVTELISPAVAEGKLTKPEYARVGAFVRYTATKPTLANEDDPRPRMKTADEKFQEMQRNGC